MSLQKRSFSLSGHRTSIALEPEFWAVLERMAEPGSLAGLVATVDADRTMRGQKLASALRVTALTLSQMREGQGGAAPKIGPPSQE